MRYIKLHNNSYILLTPKGKKSITIEHINFHKIVKLLQNQNENTTDSIMELLKVPSLPNGLFKAYANKTADKIIIQHYPNGKVIGNSTVCFLNHSAEEEGSTVDLNNCTFLGVYISKEDIMKDWPEYYL